jgi:LysR family transcriptional activator of mexEF-oprN operon
VDTTSLRHADFRRIDLNLLVIFDALMEERHVGKAAARVFIGQPAMSHALSRLREALGDDVFVRSGARMEPTSRALELAPSVRKWLEEANDFLFVGSECDLTKVNTTVRIATVGGLESALLPPLFAALHKVAPGVRLWAQMLQRDEILPALDEEEIDLAVGPVQLPFKEWHHHESLFQSGIECVYCPKQITLPEIITAEVLAPLEHATLSWRGGSGSEVDHYFEARGLKRNIVVTSTNQLAVVKILTEFPMVSLQTALITDAYRGMPDIAVRPVIADGLALDVGTVWHRRNDKQPVQDAIRKIIRDILGKGDELVNCSPISRSE